MSLQTVTTSSVEAQIHPARDVSELLTDATKRSVIQTFEKMFGETEVSSTVQNSSTVEGVVGLISFVGDITCSLAMTFPQKAATNLAYKFAGFEIDFESPDMGDVVGEIVNVLAGVVCGELESEGVRVQMSLPTVTRVKYVELLLGGHLSATLLQLSIAGNDVGLKLIISKNDTVNPLYF